MNIRVYTDYDPIRIVSAKTNSADADLEIVANLAGLTGNYESVQDSDLPATKDDRYAWKFENGKVKVDSAKKAAKDAEKQAKKDAKDAVLSKLGLTEQELKDLLG